MINIEKQTIKSKLKDILGYIKKKDIKLHAFLTEGKPKSFEDNILTIKFPEEKEFHCKSVRKGKEKIENMFAKVLGEWIELNFELENEDVNKIKDMVDGEEIKADVCVIEDHEVDVPW